VTGRSVRRLAAVDMYGATGTARRRRIIVAEFLVGVIGCGGLGAVQVLVGSGGARWLGAWLIGVAINYVPLAIHAIALSRPGALAAELAGVDVPRELRRYGVAQLWIAVPLVVAVAALVRALGKGK
jgi:hypothetical protein